MNSITKIFSLVFFSMTCIQLSNAMIDVDIDVDLTYKNAIANCTGGNNICNVTIGAIGEVVTLDVTGQPKTELGTITKTQSIKLDLSDVPNTYKVYSFTPSKGDFANQPITLLIQNVAQKPGSRLYGQTVFKLSRQVKGDKPNQWMWVADFVVTQAVQPKQWPFIVLPDGTFITFDTARSKESNKITINPKNELPAGIKKEVLYVGSKNLNR